MAKKVEYVVLVFTYTIARDVRAIPVACWKEPQN
jgi:hypothetical protein